MTGLSLNEAMLFSLDAHNESSGPGLVNLANTVGNV
jgi:hypothetical protein